MPDLLVKTKVCVFLYRVHWVTCVDLRVDIAAVNNQNNVLEERKAVAIHEAKTLKTKVADLEVQCKLVEYSHSLLTSL